MEYTRIDPKATLEARIAQLEGEHLSHVLARAEAVKNPDLTGDAEAGVLSVHDESMATVERAHAVALAELDAIVEAEPEQVDDEPGAESTE